MTGSIPSGKTMNNSFYPFSTSSSNMKRTESAPDLPSQTSSVFEKFKRKEQAPFQSSLSAQQVTPQQIKFQLLQISTDAVSSTSNEREQIQQLHEQMREIMQLQEQITAIFSLQQQVLISKIAALLSSSTPQTRAASSRPLTPPAYFENERPRTIPLRPLTPLILQKNALSPVSIEPESEVEQTSQQLQTLTLEPQNSVVDRPSNLIPQSSPSGARRKLEMEAVEFTEMEKCTVKKHKTQTDALPLIAVESQDPEPKTPVRKPSSISDITLRTLPHMRLPFSFMGNPAHCMPH